MEEKKKVLHCSSGFRQDILVWNLSLLFLAAYIGAIFGFGHLRGWDAQSGHTHNESLTSKDRFLPEPEGEASSTWYYWQLPPSKATSLTRLFAWLSYSAHQLTIWATIYYAQKKKTNREISGPKYSDKIIKIHWLPLILNLFFNILHLVQTHTTYNALAADVTESSSVGAFSMFLVLILLMEYRDRGLVFGWPTARNKDRVSRRLRLSQGPVDLLRKYHGYAFAWATIYNLWYHPMENTWAHVTGYIHIWLILVQGSLMYTNLHLNRYWRLTLESWPIIHGTVTAYQVDSPPQSEGLWSMFCFGFLWIFVMTQLFGLPFWKKLPWWTRFMPFLLYLCVVVWCYSWIPDPNGRNFVQINEVIRIPAIEYVYFIIAWFVLEIYIQIEKRATSYKSKSKKHATVPPNPAREVFYILCFMVVHVLMIGISYLIQEMNWQLPTFSLLVIGITYLTIVSCVGVVFMQSAMYWGTILKEAKSQIHTDLQTKSDVAGPGVENGVFSISETV